MTFLVFEAAAELSEKAQGIYDQSIRHIDPNLVCRRRSSTVNLQADKSEVKKVSSSSTVRGRTVLAAPGSGLEGRLFESTRPTKASMT